MLMYIIMYVCGYQGGALPDLDFCAIFVPCEHEVTYLLSC